MQLNIAKCKVITFSRKRVSNRFLCDYAINGEVIKRCTVMNDLGVLLDEKVNMNEHVDNICKKAMKIFGLVKRQAKIFDDPYVTKSLFCSLVRPILEYCTVAWMPFTKEQCNRLESVQKQFLLFALRNLGWRDRYVLPSYRSRLRLLNMDTLNDRRIVSSCVFMYKLMNEMINVKYLKDKLIANDSIYITRNRASLIQISHSTDYGMNEPLTRMIRFYNLYEECFLNNGSISAFKSKIKNKLFVND